MQLGTRWPAHAAPPQNLEPAVKSAILEVEDELSELAQDTSSWFWTLTYLESRPVVQLDDGTTIRMSYSGLVSITSE